MSAMPDRYGQRRLGRCDFGLAEDGMHDDGLAERQAAYLPGVASRGLTDNPPGASRSPSLLWLPPPAESNSASTVAARVKPIRSLFAGAWCGCAR